MTPPPPCKRRTPSGVAWRCWNLHAEAVQSKTLQNTGPGCATHAALLCSALSSRQLLLVSPAITSGCMLRAVIARRLFFCYLPPSPQSKHFPTPANFWRCVLICNSLGCFLRLHATLSCMHNLQRHIRVCAHKNPKASQQGVATYLILTYCSYWILCPRAPLPPGRGSRRTKMFLLFTHRLITADCAASLHCRLLFFLLTARWLTPRRNSRKRDTSTLGR